MSINLFILAGNGPYDNRGCEAIIRGTIQILRHHFDNPEFIVCSHFRSIEHLHNQQQHEFDKAVRHVAVQKIISTKYRLWDKVIHMFYQKFPRVRQRFHYRQIINDIGRARAVLSVGGDNYCLDYGIPTIFTDLDDLVVAKGGKQIIWGASIGPYTRNPTYESYMSEHLKIITSIFARESLTIGYLRSIGVVQNVVKMVDPAFVLEAREPHEAVDSKNLTSSIGINLSPLMHRYCCNGDENAWLDRAVDIVSAVNRQFDNPILLIPHVYEPYSDDRNFLEKVRLAVSSNKVTLLTGDYSAAELKWFISKLLLLAAARTHATIAGFSSMVPTISFAYSIKATGLNHDIYGHQDLCIQPDALTANMVCDKINYAIEHNAGIRTQLAKQVEQLVQVAFQSGKVLSDILSSGEVVIRS
jgi:polysaccharide pyruvyl transferase WcaK-like protein